MFKCLVSSARKQPLQQVSFSPPFSSPAERQPCLCRVPKARASVAAGDVQAIQQYLDANPEQIENRSIFQSNLLHIAARNGRVAVVHELLQRGIDMNALDFGGMRRTALHWACQAGNVHIVELLVDHGADTKIWCSQDILDQLHQVQGRAWSQLVQGKRCGRLIDTDAPFEDSPAALCANHSVRLALERPPWTPEKHRMWPPRFKEAVRLLLLVLHGHEGTSAADGKAGLQEQPGAAHADEDMQCALSFDWDCCRDIIARAAYPISAWV